MPLIIGTDESGLGPNLGPLVVTATVWKTKNDRQDLDKFAAHLQTAGRGLEIPIELGDSKSLFNSGGTLEGLEQVVIPALLNCNNSVDCKSNISSAMGLISLLSNQVFSESDQDLFLKDHWTLPLATDNAKIDYISTVWVDCQLECDCSLEAIYSKIVFPARFNEQIMVWNNKSTVLTSTTLEIVKDAFNQFQGDTQITCDRHGGRKCYHSSIQQFLTDHWVTIEKETANLSKYSWGIRDHHYQIEFVTRGERFPEVGLASMVSKYVRELTMYNWNLYWEDKIPGIKHTAGYPVDAKRFLDEIQQLASKNNLSMDQIWRSR